MSNMTNTFDKQTAKFLAMVAQSMPELSGDAMQTWIECPRALQRALYGSLFLPMQPNAPGEFRTWKMLTLKAYKDIRQILMAFALNSFSINRVAAELMKEVKLRDTETEIELVIVSARDLGITKKARRDVIFYRAEELGLELIPAELIPQIRLAYPEQPLGELLFVGALPVIDEEGFPHMFRIICHGDNRRELDFTGGQPDHEWDPDYQWIFARKQK